MTTTVIIRSCSYERGNGRNHRSRWARHARQLLRMALLATRWQLPDSPKHLELQKRAAPRIVVGLTYSPRQPGLTRLFLFNVCRPTESLQHPWQPSGYPRQLRDDTTLTTKLVSPSTDIGCIADLAASRTVKSRVTVPTRSQATSYQPDTDGNMLMHNHHCRNVFIPG